MKDICNKELYMIYVICEKCFVWTPIYSMSIDSLRFDLNKSMGAGLCLLCDEKINRNKFTNIKQNMSGNHEIKLLSQIIHSQTQISAIVKNSKNEKVSIISNIHQMLQDDFKWNNDFDVVAFGRNINYIFLLTPNNRSLLSLCAS